MYKDYEIENFGNGFTVFFNGDEFYFDTIEKAKGFIDEMTEKEFELFNC